MQIKQEDITQTLDQLVRSESGRILAVLLLTTNDLQLAEDALQDAIAQALKQWPIQAPQSPVAWLCHTAKRRLVDRLRRERSQSRYLQNLTAEQPESETDTFSESDEIADERLRLIFTCCHPALAEDVRVPLTLKSLCGLKTREIARAYLCSESAMEKRLSRAKQKIRLAGIAYEVPQGKHLSDRLDAVLQVIYLIYNESYNAFEGQSLSREDLATEAIYLARMVAALLPEPEAKGLLALILLHDARRKARSTDDEMYIPLAKQNRGLWLKPQIREGNNLVLEALAQGQPGKYQLQAAISALHATAPSWQTTDWQQITALYGELYKRAPSPVVALNQAMALAQTGALGLALKQLQTLELTLKQYQPFYAARADLYLKLRNLDSAAADFEQAIKLSKNEAERQYLKTQLALCN